MACFQPSSSYGRNSRQAASASEKCCDPSSIPKASIAFRKSSSVPSVKRFPTADDEYTPAQRRVIDARLDESEEDLKRGRTAGPFGSASEMIAHMKGELKKRAAVKIAKR
jgi:hypothetical protein